MIRLKKIKIKGFKDPDEEKELTFSDEPISVIYGQNGSGKTTLLKILFGVLSQDASILVREKIQWIDIEYEIGKRQKKWHIKSADNYEIDWGNNIDLYNTSSILFGVYRGVRESIFNEWEMTSSKKRIFPKKLASYIKTVKNIFENVRVKFPDLFDAEITYLLLTLDNHSSERTKVENLLKLIKFTQKSRIVLDPMESQKLFNIHRDLAQYNLTDVLEKNEKPENRHYMKRIQKHSHISTDFVKISDIQQAIIEQYSEGQAIISRSIKTALFETIDKAVEIEEQKKDFRLPNDFYQRLEDKKEFILKVIASEKDSSLNQRIKKYLETKDESLIENSRIFRSMLLNIVESAEEPNPPLEAVNKLLEIFNEHLYKNKKLIVTEDSAYIDLGNGKSHSLGELSSGERNLLSLLTLFLIIGKDRNFLMIDEPEISFNIKWQRDFLPLLSRLNSNAQIIVASHSPSIAHENSNYLVELK